MVGEAEPRPRLQTYYIDAALDELVGQRPAARAGTDHHNNRVILEIKCLGH